MGSRWTEGRTDRQMPDRRANRWTDRRMEKEKENSAHVAFWLQVAWGGWPEGPLGCRTGRVYAGFTYFLCPFLVSSIFVWLHSHAKLSGLKCKQQWRTSLFPWFLFVQTFRPVWNHMDKSPPKIVYLFLQVGPRHVPVAFRPFRNAAIAYFRNLGTRRPNFKGWKSRVHFGFKELIS